MSSLVADTKKLWHGRPTSSIPNVSNLVATSKSASCKWNLESALDKTALLAQPLFN
jgi:hypothetical protein